jgi:hypothetical protein
LAPECRAQLYAAGGGARLLHLCERLQAGATARARAGARARVRFWVRVRVRVRVRAGVAAAG